MDFLDELADTFSLEPPTPKTPEQTLYDYWVNTKPHAKIYNCQYWLKHELFVYKTLIDKGCNVYKRNVSYPSSDIKSLDKVSIQDLTRELLKYYFRMVTLPSFEGERHAERGTLVDLEKFVDLVIEHPVIKKLMENPNTLI